MTVTEEEPQVSDFGGLRILWDQRVLRPRSWTTAQSHWASAVATSCPDGPLLELFCGAGQIGLLAAVSTGRPLVQVDSDPVAAAYARRNAAAAGIVADVRVASVEDALGAEEQAALVVLDPPWVPSVQVADFPEDPIAAIDGGVDGTAHLVTGLEVALRHLRPGGHVVAQVGHRAQVEVIRDLLKRRCPDRATPQWRILETRDHLPDGVLVDIGPPIDDAPPATER